MNALELKNVSFAYSGYAERKVLSDCNFHLQYGKLVLLSGTSGEGKSTLFWTINGIIPSVVHGELSGEILIDGDNVLESTTGERAKKIGSVLQNADSQIIQALVKDEIAFGCENLGVNSKEIERRINLSCIKMELNKNAKTRTLSGGQKQRLITASTLAMQQKIIILDEPLANLDTASADKLMRTLSILAKIGYAVMVIEHRIDKVLPYADEVWRLYKGETEKVIDKKAFLSAQTIKIKDTAISTPADTNIFKLENVCYNVKKKAILKDISFDIKKGERLLILGENGCGKTTLTKIIARLLKSNKGDIAQNLNVKFGTKKRGNAEWYKNVGYIHQNPNYQLFMPTVEQEILFSGYSLEYCQKIVDMFGIRSLLSRHPQSLSEGQKRKVSIAVVLATKPKVLILDEPTVGQDYTALKRLVEILNTLHDEEQNTMITITHDVRCAEALCDKAILIDNGTITSYGNKDLVRKYFDNQ